jgi:hypothetical protein
MRRKRKAFEKEPVPPHVEAERVMAASSQPVSTQAPIQTPDRAMRAVDESNPESGDIEKTMKDYYDRSDVEGQGGVPQEPPDWNPLPLQHPEKPKRPPQHNM